MVEKVSDLSVEEVLQRRIKKPEYITIPTPQEGISLRVEKGCTVPKFTAKAIGELALSAKEFARRKTRIKNLNKDQEEPVNTFRDTAYSKVGFRGIESIADKFLLTVTPTYKINWDFDKLRKSLGAAYEAVATESLETNILIPLGRETGSGPLTAEMLIGAINSGLLGLGFSEDELQGLVKFEQTTEVDEVILANLMEDKRLKLVKNVGTVALSFAIDAPIIK
jgi:hypothetical protein